MKLSEKVLLTLSKETFSFQDCFTLTLVLNYSFLK
jgi:hypothetical protein